MSRPEPVVGPTPGVGCANAGTIPARMTPVATATIARRLVPRVMIHPPSSLQTATPQPKRGATTNLPGGCQIAPAAADGSRGCAAQCDCLDLDPGTGRQRGHLYGRARGMRVREVARIELVHERHLAEVDQGDGSLDDVLEPVAGRAQHRRQVVEGPHQLLARAALDQTAGRGVDADLAGEEHQLARQHRLRIACDGRRRIVGLDGAPHSRTRCTFITPRTRPRFLITRFSSSMLDTISSNVLAALWSPIACTCARAMLVPVELIAFDIAASSPGRSIQVTSMRTARGVLLPFSHCTSMRRCGSVSSTLGQSYECTVTPRPRVMNPAMRSPGSGWQHLPKRTSMSSTPETRTPLFGWRLTSRIRRCSAPSFCSRRRSTSSSGKIFPRTCCAVILP